MIAKCGRCAQEFDPKSLIQLWDGKRYCIACVDDACPGLAEFALQNARLEEVLETENFPVPLHGRVILLAASILMMAAAITIASLPAESAGLVCAGLFLPGIVWLYFGIMWLLHRTSRNSLPRHVWIEDGIVCVEQKGCVEEFSLADCRWRIDDTRQDRITYFMSPRPAAVLYLPDLPFRIACGLSAETLAHWRGFLRLAKVTVEPAVGWRHGTTCGATGIAVGALAGYCIGWLTSDLVNDTAWSIGMALLGAIDGVVLGLFFALRIKLRKPINADIAFLLFMKFAVFALLVMGPRRGLGIRGAFWAVLILAIANGLLMLTAAWLIDWLSKPQRTRRNSEV